MVDPIPLPPDIITVSDDELTALKLARGGFTTEAGTPEAAMFERFEELGLAKLVMGGECSCSWRLSGYGLTLAYSED
jgi:hypothetical protein